MISSFYNNSSYISTFLQCRNWKWIATVCCNFNYPIQCTKLITFLWSEMQSVIEGFISKVTYLQFFKIWSWAYQGIQHTFFDGIHNVFCWKRRKYQFQEPLKVRVISKVTHIPAVFISKESHFLMANRNSLRYHVTTKCIMAVVVVLCCLIITKSSYDEIGCREFAPVL